MLNGENVKVMLECFIILILVFLVCFCHFCSDVFIYLDNSNSLEKTINLILYFSKILNWP